jgi:hypothetical protein
MTRVSKPNLILVIAKVMGAVIIILSNVYIYFKNIKIRKIYDTTWKSRLIEFELVCQKLIIKTQFVLSDKNKTVFIHSFSMVFEHLKIFSSFFIFKVFCRSLLLSKDGSFLMLDFWCGQHHWVNFISFRVSEGKCFHPHHKEDRNRKMLHWMRPENASSLHSTLPFGFNCGDKNLILSPL